MHCFSTSLPLRISSARWTNPSPLDSHRLRHSWNINGLLLFFYLITVRTTQFSRVFVVFWSLSTLRSSDAVNSADSMWGSLTHFSRLCHFLPAQSSYNSSAIHFSGTSFLCWVLKHHGLGSCLFCILVLVQSLAALILGQWAEALMNGSSTMWQRLLSFLRIGKKQWGGGGGRATRHKVYYSKACTNVLLFIQTLLKFLPPPKDSTTN